MGGYSYFGRSPRPPFCPPRGAEATVKKIFLGTWIWIFLLKMVKMAVPVLENVKVYMVHSTQLE